MMPVIGLSSQPVIAEFKSADAIGGGALRDYEQGGVAIGDPSQGLYVQTWEMEVDDGNVRLRTYPDGEWLAPFFRDPDISEISFAFDQNMQPVFAYRSLGMSKLRWYDPLPGVTKFVTTNFPGTRDLRVCLDDKREVMTTFSDILMFYLKDDPAVQPQRLFMRQQRDRYGIEYEVGSLPVGVTAMHKVGMAVNQRLRVALWGHFEQEPTDRRDPPPYPPGVDVGDGSLVLDFRKAQRPYFVNGGWQRMQFEFEIYVPPVSDAL